MPYLRREQKTICRCKVDPGMDFFQEKADPFWGPAFFLQNRISCLRPYGTMKHFFKETVS